METPYNQYSLLLDRTARKVKWYAQQQFRELEFDMTVDQWLVLKIASENKGISQNELAKQMYKDMPTVTRIVDLLVAKGLIQRQDHPHDRRCFVLVLTQAGEEKVLACKDQVKAIRLKAWEGLDENDFREFNRILTKIYDNLTV